MRLDLLRYIHCEGKPLAKLTHKCSPVAGIGAKPFQCGIPVAGRLRRKDARLGVVDIGGMNHDSKQIAHHIDDDMSFASFCFFPRQSLVVHLPPRF